MATLQQITEIHDTLGDANTLSDYLHALNDIGVLYYDSFISDGHSDYYCSNNEVLISKAVHPEIAVADTVNKDRFIESLKAHEDGKIDYFEMSETLASSGVDRWRFDTVNMSITYFDKAGNILLGEKITP